MARILAISSQVARGHVGLSAIVPALQALGHEVIALPTVLLSNHPGHAHAAGERVAPALLGRMLDALEANGWLRGIDALITGYLPSVEHVAFAQEAVERVRRQSPVRYVCDPVLGDDPKGLYIGRDAAEAIRAHLVPRALFVTPNRFELSFIGGIDVRSPEDALRAIRKGGLHHFVLAKSLPGTSPNELVNLIAFEGVECYRAIVPRRLGVPNGTGDLMSALVAICRDDLGRITAVLDQVIGASAGRDELELRALPRDLAAVERWPVMRNPDFIDQLKNNARGRM